MKKIQSNFTRVLSCILILILGTLQSHGQDNGYNCHLKNINQINASQMEFDIWLEWTGSNSNKFQSFQAGINFNYSGIANGGTLTGALVPGSVDPSLTVQQTPNWHINLTSKQIRMLAQININSGMAQVTPPPPGFRLGTFRITNTVAPGSNVTLPFTSNSNPNFAWSYSFPSGIATQTKVTFFINGATTGTDVTQPNGGAPGNPFAIHTVTNTILNSDCQTAHTGGPYSSCGDVHLNGHVDFNGTGTWSSSGSGTFDPDASSMNAIYHPSPADHNNGSVTLTLNSGPAGNCQSSTETTTITFTSIDDSNVCTADGCDQQSGNATHENITDDGNACTLDACDPQTGNITHTVIDPDDGDACTADGCDSDTGVFHTGTCPDAGYNCHLKNITQINANQMEFDIWLEWTGTSSNKFQAFQGGIDFNYSGMANGGTITGSLVPGSVDPSLIFQQSPHWSINQISKQIRLLAVVATSSNLAATCPPPPGFRLGKFRITNTTGPGSSIPLPFTTNSSPDFAWSFSPPSSTKTQTNVLFYLNGSTLGTSVTQPVPATNSPGNPYAIHTVENIILNLQCPEVFTGGPYYSCGDVHLNGIVEHHSGSTWSSSGLGTFDPDATALNAIYHPSLDDLLEGNITLTLISDAFGDCPSIADFTTVFFIPLDDENLCTTDGCDNQTGLVTHINAADDGNNCTEDACDSNTGNISHTDISPILTATPGIIACYGGTTCINIEASGGTLPYSGTGLMCGYGAGTHTFTVTDNNNCSVDVISALTQPLKMDISVDATSTDCIVNTGTATAEVSGGTPGYTYLWTPDGQTTETATGLGTGSYIVTVTDANECTATASVFVTLNAGAIPAAPGNVIGALGLCRGDCATYSVPLDQNATSYVWTLPNNTTGTSSTNVIVVCANNHFNGGFVCVKAQGACGLSPGTCKNIIRINNNPATPANISGPGKVCSMLAGGAVYSIAAVSQATSYTWQATGGLSITSGQGSNMVSVSYPAGFSSGKLKVKANNCKGSSGERSKDIKGGSLGNALVPSGPFVVCKNSTRSYTTSATGTGPITYTWTANNGAIVSGGQGSNNAHIKFNGATSSSVTITVTASNQYCGSSQTATRVISLTLICREGELTTENPIPSLSAYPNPTNDKVTVSFVSERNEKYMMRVVDMVGRIIVNESISAIEGINKNEINLQNAAKGLYLISIQNEEGEIQTLRLVVE